MSWKVFAVIIVVLVVIVAGGYYFISGHSLSRDTEGVDASKFCVTDEHCKLSLCDCDCYYSSYTPEKRENIVCGKNCLQWYNVSGCKCENEKCVKTTI